MYTDFSCRMALPSDSMTKIAKYLHLTDPYIYPHICADPEDPAWVEFIRLCTMTEGNVYHLSHLAVLLRGDEIIGVACVTPCGKALTITQGIQVPAAISQRILPVVEGYFEPLSRENQLFSGFNIINICVDTAWQHRGLGKMLLDFCLERCQNAPVHLDVIADNAPALRLYERSGFQISSTYMGFTGNAEKLPCHHMIKKAAP